jgi:hypothetical protein
MDEKSPVTGDCHAGIRGSREVQFLPATRPVLPYLPISLVLRSSVSRFGSSFNAAALSTSRSENGASKVPTGLIVLLRNEAYRSRKRSCCVHPLTAQTYIRVVDTRTKAAKTKSQMVSPIDVLVGCSQTGRFCSRD